MATKLGSLSTGTMATIPEVQIPIDETIGGIIFDIGTRTNVFSGYSVAKNNFEGNQVLAINNLQEAVELGITANGILSGIPYYHIQQFYDYVGYDKKLYVMFADITNSSVNDSPIETMVSGSNCEVFYIGIWTETNIFSKSVNNIVFSNMIQNIHNQTQLIKGTSEEPTSYPSAVNVVVCGGLGAGTTNKKDINYKDLPNGTEMDFNLVSILIGQDTSAPNLSITPNAQIGVLGIVMGCLALRNAEVSVACIKDFDLNKNDSFSGCVLGFGTDGTNIQDINHVQSSILTLKGYIFPTVYDEKEGGIYLSSDSTMSMGDWGTISGNSVLSRLRRVIRRALTPTINGRILFERNIERISQTSIAEITNSVKDAIDTYMTNAEGQLQVSAYSIIIDEYQPNLKDDQLEIEFAFSYLESEDTINFVERYNTK